MCRVAQAEDNPRLCRKGSRHQQLEIIVKHCKSWEVERNYSSGWGGGGYFPIWKGWEGQHSRNGFLGINSGLGLFY